MLFAKYFRQKDVMLLSETVNRQYTTLMMFLKHGYKKTSLDRTINFLNRKKVLLVPSVRLISAKYKFGTKNILQ